MAPAALTVFVVVSLEAIMSVGSDRVRSSLERALRRYTSPIGESLGAVEVRPGPVARPDRSCPQRLLIDLQQLNCFAADQGERSTLEEQPDSVVPVLRPVGCGKFILPGGQDA